MNLGDGNTTIHDFTIGEDILEFNNISSKNGIRRCQQSVL